MSRPIHWKSEFLPLAQRWAARTAVMDLDGAVTYAALFGRAAGVAQALLDRGKAPCTPVATYLANGRSGGIVRAAAGGLVVAAEGGEGEHGGYGCYIVLAHREPDQTLYYSVYAHLRRGTPRVEIATPVVKLHACTTAREVTLRRSMMDSSNTLVRSTVPSAERCG